jgi:hypothetical protein
MEGGRPLTDGKNGLAVVQVLEAANISLSEKRRVFLDEIGDATPKELAAS